MRRLILRVAAALAVVAVAAQCALMTAVFVAEHRPDGGGAADAVIVLGARVLPDGSLSGTLERRVEKAFSLYAAGRASAFVLCGARGADEPVSEARAMADRLARTGVPASALLLEESSYDTAQNLAHAREIMRARGWDDALLVTSAYHLTRALWLASDAGIRVEGVAADNPPRWIDRMEARARESLSWINYFTGGRIRRLLFGRQAA